MNKTPAAAKLEHAQRTIRDEGKYLDRQAERAKAAMRDAWTGLRTDALTLADPRPWVGRAPWISLTAAATGGFLGAMMLTRSKKARALKELAAIHKRLHPDRPAVDETPDAAASSSTGGLSSFIASHLFDAIKPLLRVLIQQVITLLTTDPTTQTNSDPGASAEADLGHADDVSQADPPNATEQ